MCGIVGYTGNRDAVSFLIEGLCRLEYRGYDSAGIGIVADNQILIRKKTGRVAALIDLCEKDPIAGQTGIGHTRWATHGGATDVNAHPHMAGCGAVAIVHNGVVENYQALKNKLQARGIVFLSETDTEVIAHLFANELAKYELTQMRKNEYKLLAAVFQTVLAQLHGTYGLAVILRDFPEVLLAARCGSPLVIGCGEGEFFVASDSLPLMGHTNQVVYLEDHQMAVITAKQLRILHRDRGQITFSIQALPTTAQDVGLNGFPHFMLKEIFEQPEALANAMRGRLSGEDATAIFGELNFSAQALCHVDRIILTGCGTSWHAALVGEYLIEELARLPVEVEYASELRYRNPPVEKGTLVFAITQSGETADTLGALRELKRKGHPTLAICNVVGSTIAREADGGIYLHAGPEIGVASTKAFTSQCLVLAMLALYFGRLRHLSFEQGQQVVGQLKLLPELVRQVLATTAVAVQQLSCKYADCPAFLYLGRLANFPVALEGALKLKEISYIHAMGYPAAEMKHGPIALVNNVTPSIFLVPRDSVYPKVVANIQEIRSRGGPVIALATEGDQEISNMADDVLWLPPCPDYLQPFVNVIPLQLLAYNIACLRGCDVDKPRNLAKSVTVE